MKRLVPLLILTLLLPAAASAQEARATSTPLDLQGAVRTAVQNNPNISLVGEMVPQAMAGRDKAYAMIQPNISLGAMYRINDREIAFDTSEMTAGLGDAFGGIYGNLGLIYGEMFQNGMFMDPGDCDEIATVNGFEDCAELTEVMLEGGEIEPSGDDDDAEPLVVQPKTQLFVAAEAAWPLNPRVIPLAKAGTFGVDAARAQVAQTREGIIGGVVQVYAGAYQLQEGLILLEEMVGLAEAHVHDVELMESAGVVTRDIVLRAKLEKAKLELQVSQMRQQSATARRGLGLLMGIDETPMGTLAPLGELAMTEESLDDARAAALRRPDRAAAMSQAAAARELSIDSGMAFLPTFAVTGQWAWSNVAAGFDDKKSSWNIGLAANLPIWDGGINVHTAREAASRRRMADMQVASLTDQIDVEVIDAWSGWESAREELPVAELERELAQENYRLVEVRYGAGEARQIELLDARAQLQQAELTLLNKRVGLQVAAVQMMQSTGQLRQWASDL
jgi:outer membrane protein TolC